MAQDLLDIMNKYNCCLYKAMLIYALKESDINDERSIQFNAKSVHDTTVLRRQTNRNLCRVLISRQAFCYLSFMHI